MNASDEWLPIGTAPSGPDVILVTDGESAWTDQKLAEDEFNGHENWEEVTHWLPIPPLPKPTMIPFEPYPKMARLNRECLITEKIDGTNSTVYVDVMGGVGAGSRNRWITPEEDNYGFAAWVKEHEDELRLLGPGMHRGEWWGQGIQRKYGLKEKRFSLFNTIRWCRHDEEPQQIPMADPRIVKMQDRLPACCHLVPVLYRGLFDTERCKEALQTLYVYGSAAAPGFDRPEGIVCFHVASNTAFKATLERDEEPKGNWK